MKLDQDRIRIIVGKTGAGYWDAVIQELIEEELPRIEYETVDEIEIPERTALLAFKAAWKIVKEAEYEVVEYEVVDEGSGTR